MIELNLSYICDLIVQKAREVEVTGGTEEDLKIGIEQILRREVWDKLGVPEPRYEFKVKSEEWSGVSAKHWGRIDALYGLCVFEYKKPNELKKISVREDAIKKMEELYIPGLLKEPEISKHIKAIEKAGYIPIITGIIWDGYHVIFVEYQPDKGFKRSEMYTLNPEVLRDIINRVTATYKKRIDPRTLSSGFGFNSVIAKRAVRALYEKLLNPSEKTKKLFDEWIRLTSQAYSLSGDELKEIAKYYGFSEKEAKDLDGLKLFFAIQTYYALIIKLLAVEVAARFYDSSIGSFFKEAERAIFENRLKEIIENLENGWYYRYFRIENFLEGEFFSWYLGEWDETIEEIVKEILTTLKDGYSVESLTYDPSTARDVFKLLYEELVPRKEVRQKLGIYTTPDWLAELIIDELISTKDKKELLNCKFLDPGAGTGTFLTILIRKLAEIGKEQGIKPSDLLRAICSNVMGFDLDCLAVLTARANYLLALASAGLLEHKGEQSVEIPVYLANSIITARELEDTIPVNNKPVKVIEIKAGGEVFYLPLRIVPKALDLLNDLKPFIDREIPFEASEVQNTLKKYGLSKEEEIVIRDFCYNKLLDFKKKGIDSVWIPILKTYLASTYYRDFDFILGNPPWIAYRYLPSDYQELVKWLIKDVYGLVEDEHLMTHMEMATLFLVRCLDIYLKNGQYLGFVMPKSIMYSDQHHNFRLGNVAISYKIEKFIDCKVEPLFYVPACAIIVKKEAGKFEEIPTIVVEGKLPKDKHKVLSWEEAKSYLNPPKASKVYLNLIASRSFFSESKFEIISRRSHYYGCFYQGATIVPQPCWFVDIVGEIDKRTVLVKTSKRVDVRGKYKDKIGPLPIEKDFLYYVLTSAEVLPFCYLDPNIAVLPIIPSRDRYFLINKQIAKQGGHVNLVKWLEEAEKIWKKSKSSQKYSLYDWLDYQHKLTNQNPNAEYIVVYTASATHLTSCVVNNKLWREISELKKPIIIEHALWRFYTNNEGEAFYLASIFNSKVFDELLKPMQTKGYHGVARGFEKKPLEFPIPKFNEDNEIHKQLSELGKKATEKVRKVLPSILKEKGYDEKLKKRGTLVPTQVANLRLAIRERLENELMEIDRLVLELFSSLGIKSNPSVTLDKFGFEL